MQLTPEQQQDIDRQRRENPSARGVHVVLTKGNRPTNCT
jgi:hypothetical protein